MEMLPTISKYFQFFNFFRMLDVWGNSSWVSLKQCCKVFESFMESL